MDTKLSIIVPVYNVEKYLSKCLESLVNQTIDNYEIIIVIDGSKDNSIDIVKDYKDKYPDLIEYYVTENRGLSAARNYGLKKAKGDYVGFVDSDDYVDVNMFYKLYNMASDGEYDVVVCDFLKITEKEKKEMALDINNNDSVYDIVLKSKAYAWNKIYRRDLFEKYNIEFPEGYIFEDICTIYPLLIRADKIGYVNEKLYTYRFNRNDSIMKSKNRKDDDIINVLKKLNEYCKENGLEKEYNDLIREINVRHIFYRIRERTKYFSVRIEKMKYINKGFKFLDINYPDWKKESKYINNMPKIKHSKIFWELKTLVKG